MDEERRFYQNPWLGMVFWTLVALGVYIYFTYKIQGWTTFQTRLIWDVILFGGGLLIWLAFFAQFILPVKTFSDRQKIFDRLLTYLSGAHGPALFIENGTIRERDGEEKKRGPGVIWLNTASGAVLRTAVKFTRVVGPGVVFTNGNEFVAGTVDLHKQMQRLGPRGDENPFLKKSEKQSAAEYAQIQSRRLQTSALSRDGIEIVPNITVIFKIDAKPVEKEGKPGSRFGYRETKYMEENPVYKAVAGQGINPDQQPDTPKYTVAWNELPALLVADLWREYLSKFTFDELFKVSTISLDTTIVTNEDSARLDATTLSSLPETPGGGLAEMLHSLNDWLEHLLVRCESQPKRPSQVATDQPVKANGEAQKNDELETGLQTIVRLIKTRLQNEKYNQLSEYGQPIADPKLLDSRENKILRDRGLRLIAVSINSLRFEQSIDEQLVNRWPSTWLDIAKSEQEHIRRLRLAKIIEGKDQTLQTHLEAVCKDLYQAIKKSRSTGDKLPTKGETVRSLVRSTRTEITRNNKLHQRLSAEIDELTELIQWIENGQLQ
jgi:hypothetical protein